MSNGNMGACRELRILPMNAVYFLCCDLVVCALPVLDS